MLLGIIAKLYVDRLVVKSYQQALKSFPSKAHFTFRPTITLKSVNPDGEDFHTQSTSFSSKNVQAWFEAFTKQIEKAIQSNDQFTTKKSSCVFHLV